MSGTSSRVVSRYNRFSPGIRAALNDVLGGSAASVLTITYGLSYSLLIFAGPLAPYLSQAPCSTPPASKSRRGAKPISSGS
jgi:SulP family sulfate permease